jgi:hypothetical protein
MGRIVRDPPELAPILERLQIGGEEGWLQLMGRFRRLFRGAAGRPQSLQREREQHGGRVMQGCSSAARSSCELTRRTA